MGGEAGRKIREGEDVSFFPVAPKGIVGAAEKFLEVAWAEYNIISIWFANVLLSRDVHNVLQQASEDTLTLENSGQLHGGHPLEFSSPQG